MKLMRRHVYARGPVDAVPVMNVVLLLLLFFMLGSSFVMQPGIKVELPRSAFSIGVPAQGTIVTVLLEPEKRDPVTGAPMPRNPMIFFNDELIAKDDLADRLAKANKGRPGQTLLLKADQSVPSGFVVELMNLAMSQKWSVVLAERRSDVAF